MEQILAGLGNRVFLLNNVHEDEPVLFETRWTLSYLRGPLARPEIERLMHGRKAAPDAPVAAPAKPPAEAAAAAPPVLPPEVVQYFVPLSSGVLHYEPRVLGAAEVMFTDSKLGLNEVRDVLYAAPVTDSPVPVDWSSAEAVETPIDSLEKQPAEGATFADLPAAAAKPKNYPAWQKSFALWLYQTQTLELFRSPSLKEVSKIGESERDFRIRLQQRAREERDARAEALRKQFAPKLQALNDRLMRARHKLEQEQAQAQQQTLQSAISIGASILGAFMGRKTMSAANVGRLGTAARQVSRIGKERGDVTMASESVESLTAQIQALEEDFSQQVAAFDTAIDPQTETLERLAVKPKKTGIQVKLLALAWL
jgi:hypothetical protein